MYQNMVVLLLTGKLDQNSLGVACFFTGTMHADETLTRKVMTCEPRLHFFTDARGSVGV